MVLTRTQTLGPGTKDGGVDVRVWANERKEGPPLLLIQCKRHSKGDAVAVQWIKALWADVTAEGAKAGLIATTSSVSKDGKKLCAARMYPLSFAENKQIVEWTRGRGKSRRRTWASTFSSPSKSCLRPRMTNRSCSRCDDHAHGQRTFLARKITFDAARVPH